jgi:hypothetical protein
VLRPEKAARNAPKCHYSRLNCGGAFVRRMVAQPIQDLSAVTHKTVGIRLPCLRCGAIGLSVLRSTKTGVFFILPLCIWRGVAAGVDRSFRVREENGAKAAANCCQMLPSTSFDTKCHMKRSVSLLIFGAGIAVAVGRLLGGIQYGSEPEAGSISFDSCCSAS